MPLQESITAVAAAVGSAIARSAARPEVASFFDPATSSVTHILHDPATRAAMIVDAVLDFDAAAGRISHDSARQIVDHVRCNDLSVEWILETHIHADHLSAANWLRAELGGAIGIGRPVLEVQRFVAGLFNAEAAGRAPFDRLFDDGDAFRLGEIACYALHVPGHTPADTAYVVGDVVLTGDTLFMPDLGTARTDFPGGDAGQLYRSIRRLLSLPPETRLLHCHDYPPAERGVPAWTSSVRTQRAENVHVRDGVDEAAFVTMRNARDATLPIPALMLASIQVNVCGGALPPPAENGRRYLTLPLNSL